MSGWGSGCLFSVTGSEGGWVGLGGERERETFKHLFNHLKKNNQSFLFVVGVFLHNSLRNVLGLISFRDKKVIEPVNL